MLSSAARQIVPLCRLCVCVDGGVGVVKERGRGEPTAGKKVEMLGRGGGG